MSDLTFTSFAAFGMFVEKMNRNAREAVGDALEEGAQQVLFVAREKFGKYQPDEGPFPAWAPLSPETLKRRAQRGVNAADEPLDESGDLRDSYEVVRTGINEAVVGSDLPYAGLQETGDEWGIFRGNASHNIPARPVLGPSILEVERLGGVDGVRNTFVDVLLNGRRFRNLTRSNAAMASFVTPGYGAGKTIDVDEMDG